MINELRQVLYTFQLFRLLINLNQKIGDYVPGSSKLPDMEKVIEKLQPIEFALNKIILSLLETREIYKNNFEGSYLVSYEDLQLDLVLTPIVKDALKNYSEVHSLNKLLIGYYGAFVPDKLWGTINNPIPIRSVELYEKALCILVGIDCKTDRALINVAKYLL